jgi:hypothetical protein
MLILPLMAFLISLAFNQIQLLDGFRWPFSFFLLISVFFAIFLAYRSAGAYHSHWRWIAPFAVNLAGFLPPGLLIINCGGLWTLRDYALIFAIPLLLSLITLIFLLFLPPTGPNHS